MLGCICAASFILYHFLFLKKFCFVFYHWTLSFLKQILAYIPIWKLDKDKQLELN